MNIDPPVCNSTNNLVIESEVSEEVRGENTEPSRKQKQTEICKHANVWFQKISLPPLRKGLEIPEGWVGGVKGPGNSWGGGGGCINNIFVFSRPTGSIIPIC